MAILSYQQPVGGIQGRVGSGPNALICYTREGRDVCRGAGRQNDPATPSQRLIRSYNASLSRMFSQMPHPLVEEWNVLGRMIKRSDKRGDSYPLTGLKAFLSINMHRLLSGQDVVQSPPVHEHVPAPSGIQSIVVEGNGQLALTIDHILGTGKGVWRVRLTPPLSTPARTAQFRALRWATRAASGSYISSDSSPQRIVITPQWVYRPGSTLGVEILALSSGYIPGDVLFVRWIMAQ